MMNLCPKLFFVPPRLFNVMFIFSLMCLSNAVQAWVYSEHRDIALQAVQNLSSKSRADFDQLWKISRTGFGKRLCENATDSAQGLKTDCLDWAAFSAIAGDHSCSGKEMLDNILNEKWLIDVANISAQLKTELTVIPIEMFDYEYEQFPTDTLNILDEIDRQKIRAKRINALRTADNKLLRADPQYATRANSNTAHFLIARPASKTTKSEYAELALSPGSEINAIGVYAWYHISALKKASRLANEPQLSINQRQIITRSMLADEGFALHFLEDVFSAGHVAGTWGEVAQRLGTHNYYNQNGLEVYTWNHKSFPVMLMGDAHMRRQDKEFAAKTISTSLIQLLDFAMGRNTDFFQPQTPSVSVEPEDFNVCTQNQFPQLFDKKEYISLLAEVLIQTPIPGLGNGLGELPRFRSEIGSFIGLAGSLSARTVDGGYLAFQDNTGYITSLDLSFRAGFGMDDVMNESGDGLVFFSIGFRSDSASSNKFSDAPTAAQAGSITAAIPARSGISVRIRLPFYLIPTDLFWLSPIYFFNKTTYAKLAATAGNGGLIPWQQGMATAIGRFQFVLGREIGITYYGRDNSDEIIVPDDPATDSLSLYQLRTYLVDLPIVEYRPFRSFTSSQSSSVIFQLFTSADIPKSGDPIIIDGVSYSLNTVWSVGIRMVFDWRHY